MNEIISKEKMLVGDISLDQLLSQTKSGVFCLVRLAMIRAKEIDSGIPSLINRHDLTTDKSATIALLEIAQGKVGFKSKKLLV